MAGSNTDARSAIINILVRPEDPHLSGCTLRTRATRVHDSAFTLTSHASSRSSSLTNGLRVVSLGSAAAAGAEDDVLRRFVTLAPNAWTPEPRADNPPQFRGEDIVDNVNTDTYLRASKASKVAVR